MLKKKKKKKKIKCIMTKYNFCSRQSPGTEKGYQLKIKDFNISKLVNNCEMVIYDINNKGNQSVYMETLFYMQFSCKSKTFLKFK